VRLCKKPAVKEQHFAGLVAGQDSLILLDVDVVEKMRALEAMCIRGWAPLPNTRSNEKREGAKIRPEGGRQRLRKVDGSRIFADRVSLEVDSSSPIDVINGRVFDELKFQACVKQKADYVKRCQSCVEESPKEAYRLEQMALVAAALLARWN
jgi:hypothetical protein